jgi:hypothetical protein
MKVSGQDMSEPLSSTEIEDVLSSIRRLVSDDMRPVPRPAASAPATGAVAGDKLILTPALRVVETKAETPVRPSPAPRLHLNFPVTPHEPRTVEINPEPASIETVVASLGAAVDATQDDWENENGDADLGHAEAVSPQEWRFSEDDEAFDEIYTPESLRAEPAPFGEALPEEAEASVAGWAQEDEAGFDDGQQEEVLVSEAAYAELDPLWVDAAEASVIAALAEQGEDDAMAAADVAGEAGAFAESAASFAVETDSFADETDSFADEGGADDEFRFNEDVLRELVRDILREELAGSMGERITRNIRKLVRAEIARSLAAQELS